MTRLAIIADDLTGAADSAAHLAPLGDVRLLLSGETAWPECDVIAVDTDTRAVGPEQAAQRVAAAVKRAAEAGIPVFKKFDSTLRGNVGPELHAAAAVLGMGERPALIVASPAFPAVGRTMADGVVLVDGVPLADGSGGSLPRRLVQDGIPSVTVAVAGEELGAALVAAYHDGTAAVVVDATTDHDLKTVLDASLTAQVPLLLAGSGGLARHYDALLSSAPGADLGVLTGPALVLVGSYSPVARSQAERLQAAGMPAVVYDSADAEAQLAAAIDQGSGLLMPDPEAPVDPTRAREVASRLADVALPVLDGIRTLVVTGGETARALLTLAGIDQLLVRGELEPGIVWSKVPGRALSVVTKAGSFGDSGVLVRCIDAIMEMEKLDDA